MATCLVAILVPACYPVSRRFHSVVFHTPMGNDVNTGVVVFPIGTLDALLAF